MSGRRLFKSLFLSYVWIALVAVIAMGWYGAHTARQTCLDRTEEDLEARARLSQRAIVESLARGPAAVDEVCKALGAASGTRITAILPDGQVVGDTEADPTTMDNHKDRPEVRAAMAGGVGQSTRSSPTIKEDLMYVAVPAYRDGELTAVVRTAIPVTEIHAIYDAIRWRILLAVLGVAAVLAAVSLWFSSRIARPLREMGAGAERFARGEFGHRLPRTGTLELNVLSRALNEMAQQLDERIRTMKCQRNELEAVLSSMKEGVLAVDNEGVIINVNQMAATLLGANDAGQLRGKVVQEVVRKAGLLEFVETSLASTAPVEDSIRIFADEDRWLHVHGTMLQDARNQKIGTLIVLHDVTRLRHLEDVRRDFVANVSHELRTPITSIKGFVETLIDGAYEDRENARRFLEIIARQADRLNAIIEDLLMLSWLEKGAEAQPGRLEPGPVLEVLRAAIDMCEKMAGEKSVTIEVQCEPSLTAPMNAHLLEQAVVNLVNNALKYSEPGSRVHVSAAQEGECVAIRVQDWGCGIERKHLSRLFERFYRVDKARSRELGGTGLGLAIVKHIALVHGATVAVDSKVGEGSTFSVHLSLVGRPAPVAADEDEDACGITDGSTVVP